LAVTTLMFALETLHASVGLRSYIEGFILDPRGALDYFGNFGNTMGKIKLTMWMLNLAIADGLLLWRLWVVWQKSWKISILPAIVYIGTLALCGVSISRQWAVPNNDIRAFFVTGQFLRAMLTLSICFNVSITSLIAGRIWWVGRSAGKARSYTHIISAIVESAALYTVASIFTLALYSAQTNAGAIAESLSAPLSALVPMFIIVRVALGQSFQGTQASSVVPLSSTINFARRGPLKSADTFELGSTSTKQDV